MPAHLYYAIRIYEYVPHAFSLGPVTFNCFVYDSYLSIRLRRVVKCVTRGDVASGVVNCDPQSIWNPRKTADLS